MVGLNANGTKGESPLAARADAHDGIVSRGMRKILVGLVAVVVVLLLILVFRASTMSSLQPPAESPVSIDVDAQGAAQRLAGGLVFPTISYLPPTPIDTQAFLDLHDYLRDSYPLVHEHLTRETVSELSLLFTWQGSDPALPAAVLMGHMDVVPVIPGTEQEWEQPPFGGVIEGGYVWGRGAMDDKGGVFAVLEAVEALLAQGYQPARTIYLAFGHDEEIGGYNGAGKIAELLGSRGADDLAFVLDEGGAVLVGGLPGSDRSVAVIGTAEKGFLSLRLSVHGEGGHSSAPPPSTNVGILAAAITRLEENPFPTRLHGTVLDAVDYIGPELSFAPRLLFANMWLFRPLVTRMMTRAPQMAAMVRTTTAATMFNAGIKDNVLPITATAVVNHRIAQGETIESVTARVNRVIDDERVEVEMADPAGAQGPSGVSDPDGPGFALLGKTVRQMMPEQDPIIAPFLVIGGTDAKYYSGRSDNVFRFFGAPLEPGDFGRFHGTGERMSIDSLAIGIGFLQQLIRNLDDLDD